MCLGVEVVEWSGNGGGQDGGDPNSVGAHLEVERLGVALEIGLGGGIEGDARSGDLRGEAGNVEDVALAAAFHILAKEGTESGGSEHVES